MKASKNICTFTLRDWSGPDFCFQLVRSRISVIWCFVRYSRWAKYVWYLFDTISASTVSHGILCCWIPQYLYVFVAQRPQQVPAVVHSWRCILCICVRKILFVDVSMYLAFGSLDDVNMKESELTIYKITGVQNTLSKSSTHPHPLLRLYRFVFFFSPLCWSALSFLVKLLFVNSYLVMFSLLLRRDAARSSTMRREALQFWCCSYRVKGWRCERLAFGKAARGSDPIELGQRMKT